MSYTVDRCINVWDDKRGDHIYVGPDADALGLLEIRFVGTNGKIGDRMVLPKELAALVGAAMIELSKEECRDTL